MTTALQNTATITAAFLSRNPVAFDVIPGLMRSVHAALVDIESPAPVQPERGAPFVPIKRSITPDFLICLESGRRLKSLKRHLSTRYGLSPEQYRARWGLPADYPMVAPNYSLARSNLAKASGLGSSGGRRPPAKKGR